MTSRRICKACGRFTAAVASGVVLAEVFWAWLDPLVMLALLEHGLLCR